MILSPFIYNKVHCLPSPSLILQHLVYFSYKCVSEAVYSSILKQTSFNFSKEIYKYTEREQLYSLTHVIISLYRGLTTFTLFSNTQRHSLSTKPTLGNSISFTAYHCLSIYTHNLCFLHLISFYFPNIPRFLDGYQVNLVNTTKLVMYFEGEIQLSNI